MPRYVVERTFPDGLHIPVDAAGAQQCLGVGLGVVERNGVEGVTWVSSYVSEDKRKTFCVYDAPHTRGDPQDGRAKRAPRRSNHASARARSLLLRLRRHTMIRVSKRGTAVAVLVAAAIAAPSASASPAETLLPSASNAGADAVGAPFAPQTQAVEAPEESGFDWGDAGIGAAGALSLLSLGAGAVVIARRSRSSHPAIG